MIAFDTATIAVYGILTAAVLSIWLPESINKAARIPIWIILAILSCAMAFYYGIVELGGILYLLCLVFFSVLVKHRNKRISVPAGICVIGFVIGLFLHIVPFFHNPLVFDNYFLSDQSTVYTKYWNFDKAAAGLILLACFGDICHSASDWKALIKNSYLVSIITIFATISLAFIFGYIEPDITFVKAYFAWAWANLIFTCIAEEMLFRGFVQKHLLYLTDKAVYRISIVILVGILFGLAHFSGGTPYVMLVSAAGIGYGYAYFRTGRIESAILTHFLLNSVHFLFFTYPFAKAAVQ